MERSLFLSAIGFVLGLWPLTIRAEISNVIKTQGLFAYLEDKCVNAQGRFGLNPKFVGDCGDLGMQSLDEPVDLSNRDYSSKSLRGSRFFGARLFRAQFGMADLTRADLRQTDMTSAVLTHALLSHAKLNGTFMRGTDFSETDLTRADLSGIRALLASFRNSRLRGARLIAANLTLAKLDGADLRGADLSESITIGTQWKDAVFDEQTRLPFARAVALSLGMKEASVASR